MFKKIIASVVLMMMVISFFGTVIPDTPVYAAGSIKLEVIKDNAPIRSKSSDDGKILRRVKKGTILTAEKKEFTLRFRWWYKLKKGEYIYSGNVKIAHDHKVVITGYQKAHPHYAIHKCKECENGAMCGPETKKVEGCEQCYPTSTESKKNNTNKIPNTNVTTKADILVPSRPSLQEEIEKNLGTPKHEHNYKLSHYESSHPHKAVYKCSCGDSYKDDNKTQKQTGCTTCYPPHKHEYKFIGYNTGHPHYSMYECSCGSGYSDDPTTKVESCKKCYPYGYGNDHFCQFVCTSKYLNEHPHYTITECSICKKKDIDRSDTNHSSKCEICNSPFKENMESFPDFHGRIYDLMTGEIIYTPEKVSVQELYDFAESIHIGLDTLGLVPVYGEVFDGINVFYYIIEGNYVDAALSGAAMVPFVGTVSTTGKIAKNTGKLMIDAASQTAEIATKKAVKEVIEEKLEDSVTKLGKKILKNYSKYPESTLRGLKKITEDATTSLSEIFYKGDILIEKGYKGTVISPAGIRYSAGSKEGHRIYHIIERHGSSLKGTPGHGTLFNVDGEDLFKLIDEVYGNGKIVGTPILQDNGNTKVIYQASKKIGFNGETKLEMIFNDDGIVTAYPTK